jgi:hypothetical protein
MHEFEHGELKSGASGKGGKGQEPPPGNSHVAQASASPRRVFLGTLFNVDFTSSRVSFSDTSARATRSIWPARGGKMGKCVIAIEANSISKHGIKFSSYTCSRDERHFASRLRISSPATSIAWA